MNGEDNTSLQNAQIKLTYYYSSNLFGFKSN